MNLARNLVLLSFVLMSTSGCSPSANNDHGTAGEDQSGGQSPHWSYAGDTGPEHWADLNADWAIARDGKNQSPIDVGERTTKELPPIEFNYQPSRLNIVNNGHTIQVNYDAGSVITIAGETYELQQFHFHSPSEHTIDGEPSDIELHLVHKSAQGVLAVVGVLINSGEINDALEPVWKHLPVEAGDEQHHSVLVNAIDLLPAERAHYSYSGSLTTPPCSEGVHWFVLSTPIEVSPDQVSAFQKIYSGNNRPIQPLNGRIVVERK